MEIKKNKKDKKVQIKLSKKEVQSFYTAYDTLNEVLTLLDSSPIYFPEETANIYNKDTGICRENEDFYIAWESLCRVISLLNNSEDENNVTFILERKE